MGAFGEKLRKQREQRGLALDAISNTTKISPRMLRALEDEHFDQLPGGVFNKGFVRAYARQVGLDEEEAITDYLTALRESQIRQQSILPDFRAPAGKPSEAGVGPTPDLRSIQPSTRNLRPIDLPSHDLPSDGGRGHDGQPGEDRRKKEEEEKARRPPQSGGSSLPTPTTRPTAAPPARRFSNKYSAGDPAQPASNPSAGIPWGMLAIALLLLTLLLAFWNLRHRRDATAASNPVTSSKQSPTPTPATTPTQPSGTAASLTVGKPSSAGTLSAGVLSPGTVSADAASPRPTPTLSGAPPSSKTAASGPGSSGAGASPSASPTGSATHKPVASPPAATTTPTPAKTNTPPAAAKPPRTFTLLIRAEKTSWISIVADGKPVAEETLIAPAHTSVRASREVVVRTRNAAGVSFLLNGKEIPAQGNEGEVKTYIFDPTGLR